MNIGLSDPTKNIMRLINSRLHGVIDYASVIFLFAAPSFIEMDYLLRSYVYSAATLIFALTFITRFELGVIKILSFRIHGLIEILLVILFTISAFWFSNNDDASGFYFCLWLAVFIMAVFVLTDFSRKEHK